MWNLGFGAIDGAKPVWRRRVLKQKSRAGRDDQASCVVLLVQHCNQEQARFAKGVCQGGMVSVMASTAQPILREKAFNVKPEKWPAAEHHSALRTCNTTLR